MFGRRKYLRKLRRSVERHRIALSVLISLALLASVIGYGMVDFFREVRQKEQLVQAASLKTELAQFLLFMREDDGFPLLDNAEVTSREERAVSVVTLRRPIFSFF